MKIKRLEKAAKAYKNSTFINSKHARPLRIQAEYFEPFSRFEENNIKATIVMFGSARIRSQEECKKSYDKAEQVYYKNGSEQHKAEYDKAKTDLMMSEYYEATRTLANRLTNWTLDKEKQKQKYYVCSGGGPGIMEAANRGAMEAGGKSVGLNISLPMEQYPNPYISEELNFEFHYFFMRKYWFVYFAKAIVVMPGGFGTLDEMMEALTLIQTEKVNKKLPIVVFGKEYWNDIINMDAMVKWGTISESDLDLFFFTDSIDEAYNFITQSLPD